MAVPSLVTTDPWISAPNPNPQAKLRLFCFPYAGGGTTTYYPWAKSLPSTIELCAVRLPGRESRLREAPHIRLAHLVENLASVLAPHFDRPFAFFGHSMGALIAFELTRILQSEEGVQPLHLIASAHRAPQLPNREPPLYHLSDVELVEEMRERYNGIPQSILANSDLMELFLPTIRADLTAIDTYTYLEAAPLSCPIIACGGESDPSVTRDELDAWRHQTTGNFHLQMFAGDHFFIQGAQAALLNLFNEELVPHLGT